MIAFVFAALMNFGSYWFSDKIVLRMYRAQAASPAGAAPARHRGPPGGAHRPAQARPLRDPGGRPQRLRHREEPQHAAVAVTEGMLRAMDEEEVEGVIAHELAHVQNRDILIASVAATIAGAVSMLAHFAQWGAIFGGMGAAARTSAAATRSFCCSPPSSPPSRR